MHLQASQLEKNNGYMLQWLCESGCAREWVYEGGWVIVCVSVWECVGVIVCAWDYEIVSEGEKEYEAALKGYVFVAWRVTRREKEFLKEQQW